MRLGIVGCGAVAERYHVPGIMASDKVELAVVCDAQTERAEALAAATGIRLVAERHDALAGVIDAAIVAVPNHLHCAIATDLLERGVHVLVEKPMALDTRECDAMIEAARRHEVVLAVGHDFRFFPLAQFTKAVLESQVLGAVRRIDLLQGASGRWPYASDYILSREKAGGGVLIDFGVHMLDLVSWWAGECSVVACRLDVVGGLESECELDLELASGAPVQIQLSRARDMRDTFVIECERATVEVGIFEPALFRVTLADTGATLSGDVPDPVFAKAPLETVFARQLDSFVEAIRASRAPLVSGLDGRRALAIVEAAYGHGQPLRHPWDFPEAYASVRWEAS
jgi:predicted dehydrogenase